MGCDFIGCIGILEAHNTGTDFHVFSLDNITSLKYIYTALGCC